MTPSDSTRLQRRAVDVLVVAANTTFGLRRDFEEITGALREAHLSVAVATSAYDGLLGPLRRLSLATDELIVAVSLRRATAAALGRVSPRAVLITTSSAGGLLPRQVLTGAAVRFDALAQSFRMRRRDALTRALERRSLRWARLALPSSEQASASFESSGADGLRSIIWHSVVRPGPEPHQQRKAMGLCYANDPEKKGLDLAIAAWSRAAPSELTLGVAGIERRVGERFLATRGLTPPPNLRWLGTLSEAEYRRLTASVSIYLSASRVEQFGTAQLEALLDGALLVAVPSNGPAVPVELAREIAPGLVASSVDSDALAQAIEVALAMPEAARAGYRTRARELLAPYTRAAFTETLQASVIPALGLSPSEPTSVRRAAA